MTPEKENLLKINSLKELNENIKNLTKEMKRSNQLNERFLISEKKKTLIESKGTN